MHVELVVKSCAGENVTLCDVLSREATTIMHQPTPPFKLCHFSRACKCSVLTFPLRRVSLEDGKSYAVKVISLDRTREDKSQIKTLGEVNHPGIIKLVDWFETPTT